MSRTQSAAGDRGHALPANPATLKSFRQEMRFAYADPPYLGQCRLYKHYHPDGLCWDDETTHGLLIARLNREFPDGWALSASAPSLRLLWSHCPDDVRVAPWVKPYASFKPGVNPSYSWEPVIFRGGRKRKRTDPTVRDFVSANQLRGKGTIGAKPDAFCHWIFDLLGACPDDEMIDLYAGSGAVTRAWERFKSQGRLVA